MLRDGDALKGRGQSPDAGVLDRESVHVATVPDALADGKSSSPRPVLVDHRLTAPGFAWTLGVGQAFEFEVTLARPTILLPVSRSDAAVRLDQSWQSLPQTAPTALSFVPAGRCVRFRQQDPIPLLWLTMHADWVDARIAEAGLHDSIELAPVLGFAHPDLVTLASSARLQLTTNGPLSRSFCGCLATHLLLHVLARLIEPKVQHAASAGRADRVARSVAFIDANLAQPITIKELASEASMSPYHFARSFKDVVGLPPHRYVILRRIEHAKTLLRDTAMSIAEIAFECGFSSQSHLTSAFKSETGFTPLRYRQSLVDL